MEFTNTKRNTLHVEQIPIIDVGKYAGTPIDQLPVSYLRWMLGQDFPKEWMEIAKRKVDASSFSNEHISISRHAVDMFSIRFIQQWNAHKRLTKNPDGIATFMAKLANEAWNYGKDVSKNRHKDDGIVKSWNGIKWVFNSTQHFPEYKEVITVM